MVEEPAHRGSQAVAVAVAVVVVVVVVVRTGSPFHLVVVVVAVVVGSQPEDPEPNQQSTMHHSVRGAGPLLAASHRYRRAGRKQPPAPV